MRQEAVATIRAAQSGGTVFVPGVIALEIVQKAAKGGFTLAPGRSARSWYEATVLRSRFRHVPVTADMALATYELPEPFHKDPADRLIVAVARLLKAPVVTIDRRILAYGRLGHVQVLAY